MTELPALMRLAYLLAPGQLELREVPVPQPGPREVLVRVEAALTCGTDLKMFQRGHARLPLPAPFGHELAGTVAAVGADVHTFAEGDAIACVPTAPCGVCRACVHDRPNLCESAVSSIVLGAYADYILLPAPVVAQHVFMRPADLDAMHAAVLEPLSCVVHGAHRVDWARHRRVAILGDGAIALLFARIAGLRGAKHVLVLGRHQERLDVARAYGAHAELVPDADAARAALAAMPEGGASLVIECVGTPESWRLASDLVEIGGDVLLFGGCAPGTDAVFDAYRLHYEEVNLIGAFHYTPGAVHEAWELINMEAVDVAPLITHTMSLEELPRALELMARREAIKVAIIP